MHLRDNLILDDQFAGRYFTGLGDTSPRWPKGDESKLWGPLVCPVLVPWSSTRNCQTQSRRLAEWAVGERDRVFKGSEIDCDEWQYIAHRILLLHRWRARHWSFRYSTGWHQTIILHTQNSSVLCLYTQFYFGQGQGNEQYSRPIGAGKQQRWWADRGHEL